MVPAPAVGWASRVMVTEEVAEGQLPLETVHTNELAPVPKAVTGDEGLLTVVRLPEPESKDHTPVPAVGVIAANVVEEVQTVWLLPAFAVG